METVKLLGVRLDSVDQKTGLDFCRQFLTDSQQHLIVTVNSEFIVQAQKDSYFKEILNKSSLHLVDTIGVVLMARLFLKNKLPRVAGADFFWPLVDLADQKNLNVYLLGSSADQAVAVIKEKHPNLKIVGAQTGPWLEIKNGEIIFDADQQKINNQILTEIKQTQPDILLVGFGAPKQEYWLTEFLKQLPTVKIAIGLGGTFDYIAGRLARPPLFFRQLGLEWLWRFVQQPSRYKRMFNALIKFPFLCFNYYILKKDIK